LFVGSYLRFFVVGLRVLLVFSFRVNLGRLLPLWGDWLGLFVGML